MLDDGRREIVTADSWLSKWLTPSMAKNVLCIVYTVFSTTLIAWVYYRGVMHHGFILFLAIFLLLLVRGVLWANFVMQSLLVLIGIVSPFIFIYRHMLVARRQLANAHVQGSVDYSEILIYVVIFEIVCFGMVFLLKKSKPAFERFII